MATIQRFPFLRHLRSEPTYHVLRYRRGSLRKDGAGLAFWFRPIATAVAEVPIDDRELPFLFRVRSADFQELVVQGVITFRVAQPAALARRVDFTLDLDTGRWAQAPLEAIQQRADEATFERRAMAVEKERAIAENELSNRIELTRREEQLVARASVNDRMKAESRAEEIALVEGAKLQVERERAEIQAALPPEVLRALALQELAGALGTVEHLTVTPDLLAPLLAKAA